MADIIRLSAKADIRVFVASDGHYWPGKAPAAHRGLIKLLREYTPDVLIFNGDVLDAPTASTHPPIGWEKFPSLEKEIRACQVRLRELNAAARLHNNSCRLIWCLGNHDARFNKTLATKVPQFKNLPGTKLSDFFPEWECCWRVDIGGSRGVVVKHEFKGGTNPAKSNALASGRSIITGHHHCQNVVAYTDCNGTRYGVDAGMLAAVGGPQFGYAQANPANWRSGFVVLQFKGGALMPPQLATILDEKKGTMWYNGRIYKV